MTRSHIIETFRLKSKSLSPPEAVELLKNLAGKTLSEFDMIGFFHEAFPEIPFSTVREASTTSRICGEGGLDDAALTELLGPWFPRR